jgi:hypothetical protein
MHELCIIYIQICLNSGNNFEHGDGAKLWHFIWYIEHSRNLKVGNIVLGGIVVSVVVTGPKVRVFRPGRRRWIFKGDKTPPHAFLRTREEPFEVWKRLLHKGKSHHFLCQFLLLRYYMTSGRIAREIWWTNQFSPVQIIPPRFFISYTTFWMNNRHVGGRSSETPHPIDMIIIIKWEM